MRICKMPSRASAPFEREPSIGWRGTREIFAPGSRTTPSSPGRSIVMRCFSSFPYIHEGTRSRSERSGCHLKRHSRRTGLCLREGIYESVHLLRLVSYGYSPAWLQPATTVVWPRLVGHALACPARRFAASGQGGQAKACPTRRTNGTQLQGGAEAPRRLKPAPPGLSPNLRDPHLVSLLSNAGAFGLTVLRFPGRTAG